MKKEFYVEAPGEGGWSLLTAFKLEVESIGYSYNHSFCKYDKPLFDKSVRTCLYFANQFSTYDVDYKTPFGNQFSLSNGNSGTKFILPEQWDEAIQFAKDNFVPVESEKSMKYISSSEAYNILADHFNLPVDKIAIIIW